MSHHGELCFKSAYQLILLFAPGGDSPARLESPKLAQRYCFSPKPPNHGRGMGEASERPWKGREEAAERRKRRTRPVEKLRHFDCPVGQKSALICCIVFLTKFNVSSEARRAKRAFRMHSAFKFPKHPQRRGRCEGRRSHGITAAVGRGDPGRAERREGARAREGGASARAGESPSS